jgi:mannose-1-phosphate guanylyltransferase/mannose-6-phosphate isomerase
MHKFRSEHWVVVRGVAKILVGDEECIIEQNESTYIPRETKHRLANPTHRDLEIIEVQSGSYLGEDDIIRFDDTYGRAPNE